MIVSIGTSCVYICVNGTLSEPLFAQFPGDSWIRLLENPTGAAEHQRDNPAETPIHPSSALVRHRHFLAATTRCDVNPPSSFPDLGIVFLKCLFSFSAAGQPTGQVHQQGLSVI